MLIITVVVCVSSRKLSHSAVLSTYRDFDSKSSPNVFLLKSDVSSANLQSSALPLSYFILPEPDFAYC